MHKRILGAALVAAVAVVCPAQATLTSTSNTVAYTGNGSTTAFTVPFKFLANSDLVVTVGGAPQTLNNAYTVKGAGNATGTVTFTTAPANLASVVITRVVPLTQTTSLRQALPFPAGSSIESELDKRAMAEQQIAAKESADFGSVGSAVAALNSGSHAATDTSSVLAFGSTTPRTLTVRFSDTANVKDFGAPCNGSGDDVPALTAAIAAIPSTGGTIDARSCAQMKLGSTLTLSKSAVAVLLPAATISMGANQIIVPVGVQNVSLVGPVPYGGSITSHTVGNGTFLAYTGTGAAIQVGDLTGDTYGFHLQDITIALGTAGTAAIGLQLNRTQMYSLTRPRTDGLGVANTQIGIDLEGGTNFTGGRIDDPYLWQGATGIYFGQNANANYVVGGIIVNSATQAGTCFNFAGTAVGKATGNVVMGTDCEVGPVNGTVAVFDWASTNTLLAARNEGTAHFVNATANSVGNMAFGAHSAGDIVDNGISTFLANSFNTVDSATFNNTAWALRNRTNTPSRLDLWAGASLAQTITIEFHQFGGARAWDVVKDAAEGLQLIDNANGNTPRIRMDTNASTYINALSSSFVAFNDQANAGTGGVRFGSGGATPTVVATVDSAGRLVQTGLTFANLGAVANGSLVYCSDCTVANPCAAGGTGAFAKRLNGAWVCN